MNVDRNFGSFKISHHYQDIKCNCKSNLLQKVSSPLYIFLYFVEKKKFWRKHQIYAEQKHIFEQFCYADIYVSILLVN